MSIKIESSNIAPDTKLPKSDKALFTLDLPSSKYPSFSPEGQFKSPLTFTNIYNNNNNDKEPEYLKKGQKGYTELSPESGSMFSTESVIVNELDEPNGPCEPGSQLHLEGVVWHETQDGVLVVNITWRGRNYVGTLLDHTKYDWAGTSYSESTEEKRNAKGRNNSSTNSSCFPSPFLAKRNGSSNNLNNSANSSTTSSLSLSSGNSSTANTSSGGGGRTTNNSIAAEYDANTKVRIHAVSPLVTSANALQTTPQSSAPKSKRIAASQNGGSRTPPPLTIVEDSPTTPTSGSGAVNSNFSSSTGGATGMKRKSEKNGPESNNNNSNGVANENKTGKKPRVTITNIGANNETLTTVLNAPINSNSINGNTNVSDSSWKCPEESCFKKYKHKNGLKYHMTHAHGKTDAEADVIIENASLSHHSMAVSTNQEQASNADEDSNGTPKLTSPSGSKQSGSKKSTSKKVSTTKEKKKTRREEPEQDSPPPSSEQVSSSSNGQCDSETCDSKDVESSISTTTPNEVAECSETIASTSNDITPVGPPRAVVIPVNTVAPSSKISRLGGASTTVPLQGTDPSSQPERKIAKVAPTTFGGSDMSKLKLANQTQIVDSSVVKGEPIPASSSITLNHVQTTGIKPQQSHFQVNTPMYPFGPVDPKLYTNFVGPSFNSHSTPEGFHLPLPDGVTKPEGTAARIVQQALLPNNHPSAQQWSQIHGASSSAFALPQQHSPVNMQRMNNNPGSASSNWQTGEMNGGNVMESPATKFVEANAQQIAEATVETVTSHTHTSHTMAPQQQQQQLQTSTQMTLTSTSSAPIASHHVHNHIHNYVGFPPPQMIQQQQHSSTSSITPQTSHPSPQNHGSPKPAPIQTVSQLPQTSIASSNITTTQGSMPSNMLLPTNLSSIGLTNGFQSMGPGSGPSVAPSSPAGQTHQQPISTTPSSSSTASPQFGSLVQGRPLAPVSPFNARTGTTQ